MTTYGDLARAVREAYAAAPDEIKGYFPPRALLNELAHKYSCPDGCFDLAPDAPAPHADSFLADAKKALSGYPLAYIVGSVGFMNGEFAVREGVLIPRADTETVVLKALSFDPRGVIYDICCGSGCIGISVLTSRPSVEKCCFLDISDAALELTRENAAKNGVLDRAVIVKCDVLGGSGLPDGCPPPDMIVANPPYVTRAEMDALPLNVTFEPPLALSGGEDGCDFYRAILRRFAPLLPAGAPAVFEISPAQVDTLAALLEKYGFSRGFAPDLSGLVRCAYGVKLR